MKKITHIIIASLLTAITIALIVVGCLTSSSEETTLFKLWFILIIICPVIATVKWTRIYSNDYFYSNK